MAKVKELVVTLGEEKLSPHRYEGFTVGPISVRIEIEEGEKIADVTTHIKESLGPVWDEMFLFQRNKYHEHHELKG